MGLVVVLLLLLLLLVVVIPRLHCYVHPTSALVRRRSWHRKMKIPSTSSATWMVRPNPRKNQTKKKWNQYSCIPCYVPPTSALVRRTKLISQHGIEHGNN